MPCKAGVSELEGHHSRRLKRPMPLPGWSALSDGWRRAREVVINLFLGRGDKDVTHLAERLGDAMPLRGNGR